MIEAVVTPHDITDKARQNFEMSFDLALAIRGKNTNSQEWNTVYSGLNAQKDLVELSRVSVTCPVSDDSDLVCD